MQQCMSFKRAVSTQYEISMCSQNAKFAASTAIQAVYIVAHRKIHIISADDLLHIKTTFTTQV
jgi:hypothetical protein